MQIGEKIKTRRMALGWSQRELADRMECNHSTITRIETGKIDISQSKIMQFSEVLGVSIAYLMGWEETQKNNDILADIIVRLRTDVEFSEIVKILSNLDAEKLAGIKGMLITFAK